MFNNTHHIPSVLTFSGHDPSGGAGLQADIETLSSHGCHATPIITAVTIQDTCDIKKIISIDADVVYDQAKTIFEDFSVGSIKIGMISNQEILSAIHTILQEYPEIPVVLDPIFARGGGTQISNDSLQTMMFEKLLPHVTVLTPNSHEARILSGEEKLDDCGLKLLECGCDYVLITGTHEDSKSVKNRLFHDGKLTEIFSWDRLPNTYHGSGCTLASSIAGLLAQKISTFSAIHEAQEYTWEALNSGYQIGHGQWLPQRFFWIER